MFYENIQIWNVERDPANEGTIVLGVPVGTDSFVHQAVALLATSLRTSDEWQNILDCWTATPTFARLRQLTPGTSSVTLSRLLKGYVLHERRNGSPASESMRTGHFRYFDQGTPGERWMCKVLYSIHKESSGSAATETINLFEKAFRRALSSVVRLGNNFP